jgi:hypothetical protein
MALTRLQVVKVVDLRPVDFQTGRRLALTAAEMERCEACGTPMAVVHVLSTGHRLGSSCATVVRHLNPAREDLGLGIFGLRARVVAFFRSLLAREAA